MPAPASPETAQQIGSTQRRAECAEDEKFQPSDDPVAQGCNNDSQNNADPFTASHEINVSSCPVQHQSPQQLDHTRNGDDPAGEDGCRAG
mmetsp:Transcript_5055/g.9858  ORF Transcript_5055/g.9858 Transcript_5055/m.9858 type:complete len:90 (-) Transcript_5055:329-598(-)